MDVDDHVPERVGENMSFFELQKTLALNKRERLTIAAEKQAVKNNGRMQECPHDYYDHSTQDGLEKKQALQCKYGAGSWCQMCQHFLRHKKQEKHTRDSWESKKQHRHDKAHSEAKTSSRWWKTVSSNPTTVNPAGLDQLGAPRVQPRKLI